MTIDVLPDLNAYPTPERAFRYLRLIARWPRLVGCDEGYVPDLFPAQHYGDYLILNIDLKPGRIKNWRKPIATDIEKMIEANQED
ncbi:hypothetical protein HBO43_01450 [Pseudomonas veronii]|jgi:hypothetical protein|uniref:Uncharacterized protein n=1 Tax=Pseudomonas veronii TaxID=76761 RepID=A0A7Y1F0U4_PSEVE|nr:MULTISPECIES: hypothetical protein [Pseudomonas]SEC89411.1 hypothetical protein SAMN04490199_5981 [Pseudomonas marginalis]KRP79704.1 hypothetical protein TU80_10150 [Pseudomonas veronii]MCT8963416.1 hypothetical protein [Pseudomonas veronii]NMX95253.1 hypothetical protein [Pseudomonas veronii]NWC58486.1 hypothetical protein [Pseudomonas veronii]